MTSNRLIPVQRTFDFADEAERTRRALEAQRSESALAAVKKTALSSDSENLMEQIVELRNIERAWKKVKANHGVPGPDGVDLDEFFQTFCTRWPTVRQQLLEGTYEPSPARRKSIPKPEGSERLLGIPVFTKTSEAARRVYRSVGRYLTRKLKLVVNRQKSRVGSTDGVEFVGFVFVGYGGQIRVSPKNVRKFKDRVREITRRNRGVSMSHRCREPSRFIQPY